MLQYDFCCVHLLKWYVIGLEILLHFPVIIYNNQAVGINQLILCIYSLKYDNITDSRIGEGMAKS